MRRRLLRIGSAAPRAEREHRWKARLERQLSCGLPPEREHFPVQGRSTSVWPRAWGREQQAETTAATSSPVSVERFQRHRFQADLRCLMLSGKASLRPRQRP